MGQCGNSEFFFSIIEGNNSSFILMLHTILFPLQTIEFSLVIEKLLGKDNNWYKIIKI